MSDSVVGETESEVPSADLGVVGILVLFRAILVKQFTIMLRYRVNFAINLVTMYVFFAIVFFGGQALAGQAGMSGGGLDSTFDGVIVGWFLWTAAQGAYAGLSGNVTQESEWGTLEQLYMSPHGFGTVMSLKAVVNVLQSVVVGGLMLLLMMLTTGRFLSVDLLTVVPVTVLATLSVVGLGFAFAGLALVYKRIESVSNLVQFGMIGLVSAPAAGMPALHVLPLVQGSELLQAAMRDGVRIWEFSVTELGTLCGVAVAYLLVGYAVFAYCSTVARRRGVMGHY